ncbi:MAG TPA: prepilin-type N-terminal cleavage/methylation domain-containing protein [Oligoflexia bacterium]|nr:prepilin-type N-terminal cleavage/methylation domain-containing protein [Oligoflexia bacterium]HMP27928.1 prepilin-type N-terminal cleavage/methylation domain-containing protein [Oligoflexia bacterium]
MIYQIRFLASRQRGFSLIELLIGLLISSVILAAVMSSFLSTKRSLARDTVYSRIQQNLEAALNIIAQDIKNAGNLLNDLAPVFELTNGAGASPDQLIIRRGLRIGALPVCQNITSGSSDLIYAGFVVWNLPGCIYSLQQGTFNIWDHYNLTNAPVLAYIYNVYSNVGEFFQLNSFTDTANTNLTLSRVDTWTYGYTAGQANVYLLEQKRYYISGNNLMMTTTGGPLSTNGNSLVAFNIKNIQITFSLNDGTTTSTFLPSNYWRVVKSVRVIITGFDSYLGEEVVKTAEGTFAVRASLTS